MFFFFNFFFLFNLSRFLLVNLKEALRVSLMRMFTPESKEVYNEKNILYPVLTTPVICKLQNYVSKECFGSNFIQLASRQMKRGHLLTQDKQG